MQEICLSGSEGAVGKVPDTQLLKNKDIRQLAGCLPYLFGSHIGF